MIAAVAMEWLSMLSASLLTTDAMVLTGCLKFRQAGNSKEYRCPTIPVR